MFSMHPETTHNGIIRMYFVYLKLFFVPLTVMYGDKMYLFADLEQAHAANDRAVMQAYGFAPDTEGSAIVAELMKMYQKLTEGE